MRGQLSRSADAPAADRYVLTADAGRLAVGQVDHMLQMMPIGAENLVVLEFDEASALIAEIGTNPDFPPLTPTPLSLMPAHSHNDANT